MIMPLKGIKKQVLGGVLLCMGAMPALLSRTIGFELDIFYVAISFFGVGLFLYGTIQNNLHKLTSEFQHLDVLCTESEVATSVQPPSMDFTACSNLASQREPIRQRISIRGD